MDDHAMKADAIAPIVIQRYARNRLYDAVGQRYVSIDILRSWEAKEVPFVVLDVETGRTLMA